MKFNGPAIGAVAVGSLFVYAGIKGYSPLKAAQNVIQGKPGSTGQTTALFTSGNGGSGGGGGSVGGIRGYAGHCYKFGGAPGPDGKGCWDCSSFANWYLSHDNGLPIPGGKWDPSTHGPTTLDYLSTHMATTIGHKAADAQAGDLCVWETHMGIALGNGQMISALNENLGTRITTIKDGAPGLEVLVVRRYHG